MATGFGSGFDAGSAVRGARRLFLFAFVVALVAFAGCSTTTRVDAGHVGIAVKLAGSDRGVQDMPVVTGWVVYNPITEQIIIFPISVQNVIWSASPHEGRAVDGEGELGLRRGFLTQFLKFEDGDFLWLAVFEDGKIRLL